VWSYSPRQLYAFQFLADKRRLREQLEALNLGTLAARGEPRNLKDTVRRIEREL
jgi:hypothetical protein